MWNRAESEIMWGCSDGDTWSIPVNISNTPGLSTGQRSATDGFGTLYVVWHDHSNGWEIWYNVYDGESWQEAQVLPRSNPGIFPDIATDLKGTIHVVWEHYISGSSKDNWIKYSSYDGASWTSPVDVIRIQGKPMSGARIAIDADDRPHVVAEKWCHDSVYYAWQDGTSWTPPYILCERDTNRGVLEPDIEIDRTSGIGFVVWNGSCYRSFCGTTWDSAGRIGGQNGAVPAIASSSGRHHLVWTAAPNIYYSMHDGLATEAPKFPVKSLKLSNRPDPFVVRTVVFFENPEDCLVTLTIFDVAGNTVKRIRLGYKEAGDYEVPILSYHLRQAGVYFCSIEAGNFSATKKMIFFGPRKRG
jgi:hypothetical protein